MKPEIIFVVFLGVVSLIIVVANDWWKRRLVKKAEGQGKRARKDLYANRTQWVAVIIAAVGFGVFVYLLSRPDLTDRDFGPLTPLIRWLFSNPR